MEGQKCVCSGCCFMLQPSSRLLCSSWLCLVLLLELASSAGNCPRLLKEQDRVLVSRVSAWGSPCFASGERGEQGKAVFCGSNSIILVCIGKRIVETFIIEVGVTVFSSRCLSFRKTSSQKQQFSGIGLLSVPSVMIIASHNYSYCLYGKSIL